MGHSISMETYKRWEKLQDKNLACQMGRCYNKAYYELKEKDTETGEIITMRFCKKHIKELAQNVKLHGRATKYNTFISIEKLEV
jgi:hypothetical protein